MAVPSTAPAGARAARWSGRLLLITAAALLVGAAAWYARTATVPLIIAALVATQLLPLVEWAGRRGIPRGPAVAAAMLLTLVVTAGLVWLFAASLFGQLGGVGDALSEGADEALAWLEDNNAWFEQHRDAIRDFLSGLLPAVKNAADGVLSGVVGGLELAAQLISGALLAFVFLLYLLTSGEGIWRWVLERFAPAGRDRAALAGRAAWRAATGYVRGIALVAFIDTIVIGAGMLVVGTPLAGTLMLLTFVSLFIPILGAWVSGVVIVLVTLGALGTTEALVMAAVILVAQQLDSMFVTPLVYQQTVSLHPIVTLTGVIVGSQLLGVIGAFLAVPLIAVSWAVYRTLERGDEGPPEAVAAAPPVPSPA
jgi:predicted PurR-regulated permease PerM